MEQAPPLPRDLPTRDEPLGLSAKDPGRRRLVREGRLRIRRRGGRLRPAEGRADGAAGQRHGGGEKSGDSPCSERVPFRSGRPACVSQRKPPVIVLFAPRRSPPFLDSPAANPGSSITTTLFDDKSQVIREFPEFLSRYGASMLSPCYATDRSA